MQIQTQLPVIVCVYNTAAIYMSQNITTTTRTTHINVRTKFVKEFCEDGIIKTIFVRSEDNDSDILTKNLQSELFGKHSRKLINRIQGTVVDIRPLRCQASLRARDLARYRELVGVGHHFGKVSVLATTRR